MVQPPTIDPARIRFLNKSDSYGSGPVIYWMSREQRVSDNWALLYAQQAAIEMKRPLLTVFCLDFDYPGANLRHFGFLLRGLCHIQVSLEDLCVPFILLKGNPLETLPPFIEEKDPALLVTDFDPLRIKKIWKREAVRFCKTKFAEVDAHNIVPCWIASDKREYAAYTIRPKLKKLLSEFMTQFPDFIRHPFNPSELPPPRLELKSLLEYVKDRSVGEVGWIEPGERAAWKNLNDFILNRLDSYSEKRNDPCLDAQSNLSPYLHFGHISPQTVALEIIRSSADQQSKDAFLEELVVRRELSDNFCNFTESYDSIEAASPWARKTLDEHRDDPRPYIADLERLEKASVEEELWNGCQIDLMERGKLHGYLRMYWAKKILEWSPSPEEAISNAIYLNDKYSLDGRDPNGYTGILWSIAGLHDRAWKERPVLGKIRYMNQKGCRRKFNVDLYLDRIRRLKGTLKN